MSSLATNTITDASGGNTTTINGYTPTVSNMAGRNRIINGDMRIDQRNAGASVTASTAFANVYTLDRWHYSVTAASKFSVQQNAGGVTPPAGFTNYLGVTSLSAYSVSSSDATSIRQIIEGFNTADLAWGTASASPVTLSFWVRSSLTGTFGGSVFNGSVNRCYPFSYTISTANTWEQKTITIAGDTSGTWATNNTAGIYLNFSMGTGSTSSGTAGSWGSTFYNSATGATSVVGTSGATFYITGVQLEAGSVATPFEHRQYGQELALCQRYYEKSYNDGVAPATATAVGTASGQTNVSNISTISIRFKVDKRATPTVTIYGTDGTAGVVTDNVNRGGTPTNTGATGTSIYWGGNTGFIGYVHYTASSEL